MDELALAFARAHGCPQGCPACETTWSQVGVPEALHRWEAFVSSKAARRLVTLCERAHRPLPQLSPDDVVQFCLEEALFELQAFSKIAAQPTGMDPFELDPEAVSEGLNPAETDALHKVREFSMKRVG